MGNRYININMMKTRTISDIIYADPLQCILRIQGSDEMIISIEFRQTPAKEKKSENEPTLPVSFDLIKYFAGEKIDFSKYEVSPEALTPFERRVLEETRKVRYGQTITYSELAKRIGSSAYRAVGNALGKNPVPVVIPCHRIVAKHGPGGYSSGLAIKKKLLELELT